MNKSTEWPGLYPEGLKRISWCVDCKAAGPNADWNEHLSEEAKDSEWFIKKVIAQSYFRGDKRIIEKYNNYIDWIVKRFTIYMRYDKFEFDISLKKDKKTGKTLFNRQDYWKMVEKELKESNLNKAQADMLLKNILKRVLDFYNNNII